MLFVSVSSGFRKISDLNHTPTSASAWAITGINWFDS